MKFSGVFLLCVGLLLQSCSEIEAPATTSRILSYDMLMHGSDVPTPVSLREFAPDDSASPASNNFSGRLALNTDSQSNHFKMLVDELNFAALDRPGMSELPPFDFAFVQDGGHLIPMRQGPVTNGHNWWEFVLRPGRVWDESADNGITRAAIPFALKELREDCIHNGLMSFLFDDEGNVSNVAFQISNQTCRYLQFEMRGLLEASYSPGEFKESAQVLATIVANRESRLPQPIRAICQFSVSSSTAFITSAAAIRHKANTRIAMNWHCRLTPQPSRSLAALD